MVVGTACCVIINFDVEQFLDLHFFCHCCSDIYFCETGSTPRHRTFVALKTTGRVSCSKAFFLIQLATVLKISCTCPLYCALRRQHAAKPKILNTYGLREYLGIAMCMPTNNENHLTFFSKED